jgi:hypothetical protein
VVYCKLDTVNCCNMVSCLQATEKIFHHDDVSRYTGYNEDIMTPLLTLSVYVTLRRK